MISASPTGPATVEIEAWPDGREEGQAFAQTVADRAL